MIKKLSIAGLIMVGLILSPISVYAQTTGKTASFPAQIKKEQLSLQKISSLKTKADNEISRRLTSLNNLVTKIGGLQKLTADQKSQLTSQIQASITELTNLKAKIDTDVDLVTLRVDVKSVITNYRVYVLFLPRIQELLAIDRAMLLLDKLNQIVADLKTKISSLVDLTDMQNKLSDAKTQLDAAQNEILPLTPESYPGNRGVLQDARKKIQAAHQDLKNAWLDAKKIRQGLKQTVKPSFATPSAK